MPTRAETIWSIDAGRDLANVVFDLIVGKEGWKVRIMRKSATQASKTSAPSKIEQKHAIIYL